MLSNSDLSVLAKFKGGKSGLVAMRHDVAKLECPRDPQSPAEIIR